ncbi:MFS transporter [Quadrisphaera sp. DSM 44207]|uniref:MFS transporter n=1 Tax=Quadrisphaera sp. DSM 44207 TaxID=1881057 RepID=UPI0008814884|nr:MFS transporter [Quadrisphaera sp. DSM 44207]SDQ23544.1 MFS-type transporter involved in bile tolerance, Atg22 family [Quadrisphaera sp. DSM 44207]
MRVRTVLGTGVHDRGGRGGSAGFRAVLAGAPYRRLLAVRLASQAGDGAFQAGLAALVLFSPERAATPLLVAVATTTAVLPFTLVGPFAGVLLDRWPRQRALLVCNAARVALGLACAAVVAAGAPGGVLLVLVLTALSVNRFLLAGLGAALPHAAPAPLLVAANAVTPTAGTGAFAAGAVAGAGARTALGASPSTDAVVLVAAALGWALAAALTLRIGREDLGPDAGPDASGSAAPSAAAARDIARELAEGAAHVRSRPAVRTALGVIGAHRVAFGVSTLLTVLLARGHLAASPGDVDAALGLLALVAAAAGAGALAAAVLVPPLARRTGVRPVVLAALVLGAATQAVLVPGVTRPGLVAAGAALGLAGQAVKIGVDTVVQTGVEDAVRGRAFALYDVVFNAATVLGALAAVLVVPADGRSPALHAVLAAGYALTAVAAALQPVESDERAPPRDR